MKMFLSTTALVVALGFPTLTLAETTPPAAATATTGAEMPGFLALRGQSDLFASDLMGHDVYARRTPSAAPASDGTQATKADGTHEMTMMKRADLDGMDNIGQINELVLSSDGQVRAIVIGIGGFLGLGEQDVAVTMDQVTFASDTEKRSDIYIVVNTTAEMLKGSPAYDRTAMTGDQPMTTDGTQGNVGSTSERTAFAAPDLKREGYNRVEVTEVTSEMLVGKTVYGVNDKSVGTIENLIVDDKGVVTNVIIDFGGFLGIGSSQVSVGYDEMTVLANDGRADVRVYVDATKEQVQAQPQYRAMN